MYFLLPVPFIPVTFLPPIGKTPLIHLLRFLCLFMNMRERDRDRERERDTYVCAYVYVCIYYACMHIYACKNIHIKRDNIYILN